MKNSLAALSSIFLLSTISGYSNAKDHTANPRPIISNNGEEIVIYPAKKVITMESAQKEATAVSVRGKKIIGVGTVAQL
ncbi:MAG: hypothetical protein RR231_11560, partial [Acinetobacter sp.]